MIVACVPNLLDRSKFPANVTFVATGAAAAELAPTLLIVDLDRCPDLEQFELKRCADRGTDQQAEFGNFGDGEGEIRPLRSADNDLPTKGLSEIKSIGFGSHVNSELLDQAREAGFSKVLARSAFFRDLKEICRQEKS